MAPSGLSMLRPSCDWSRCVFFRLPLTAVGKLAPGWGLRGPWGRLRLGEFQVSGSALSLCDVNIPPCYSIFNRSCPVLTGADQSPSFLLSCWNGEQHGGPQVSANRKDLPGSPCWLLVHSSFTSRHFFQRMWTHWQSAPAHQTHPIKSWVLRAPCLNTTYAFVCHGGLPSCPQTLSPRTLVSSTEWQTRFLF